MRTRFQTLALAGAVAALYLVTGKLALHFAFLHASASAVWPPTGIALAALLLLGRGLWPAVFVGAFLVNLTAAGSVAACAAIAGGNTIEAVVGAWLVERYAGGRRLADDSHDMFRFLVTSATIATISATVGVASLVVDGSTRGVDPGAMWLTWWTGRPAAWTPAPCG